MQVKKIFENRYRRTELLIGAVLLALMLFAQAAHWLEPVELLLLDARFRLRGERRMPSSVVAVGIDEASLDYPRSGPWPWPRGRHAEILYNLNQEDMRPKGIGYDPFFESQDPKDETGDSTLVYRAEEAGKGLVLAYFFEKGFRSRFERDDAKEEMLRAMALTVESMPPRLEKFDKVSLPYQSLARHALLGFTNLTREAGGATRRLPLLALYRGKVYPSMELLLAARAWGFELSDLRVMRDRIVFQRGGTTRTLPVTPEGDLWINFYGKALPEGTYYSFIKAVEPDSLLTPAQTQEMKRAIRAGVVIVGKSAASLQESHATPFERSLPGLMVRVQGLSNLLNHQYLVRVPAAFSLLAVFAVGLLVMVLALALPVTRSVPLAAALAAAYFLFTCFLFLNRLWLDAAVPEASIVLIFLAMISYRYFTALEELKKIQHELIHSEKLAMVGQISSNMAHEFRNILHAIKLHVEGCARPGTPPERVQKYMGVIFKTMENAERILNGILTFSRKNQSDKKPGSLKKTVEDTLLLLERELHYQNIKVESHLDEVAEFDFDSGQMSQVIMNLINNARDALQKQQQKMVMIRLREDGPKICLDIADNGPGIPPQVMKDLFKPFVTSKEAGKGTGLGLSMCQRIVQNHGGDITVNTVQGQGTVWHIQLPKV